MTEGRIERLFQAFKDSVDMDDTHWYLERGRAYAGLAIDALEAAWVDAFKAFLGRGDHGREIEYFDLSAEFRLRGISRPEHLIASEDRTCQEACAGSQPSRSDEGLRKHIRHFFSELAAPKN